MQEAESLSLSGSSADDYFCGATGSWCRQGSDTNLILCIHTELSPPGLAETFANNVIFGGRGGHVEPPSSTSCSSGDHCTSKERCGTDRQTHRHSWEEGDIPPSCCEVLSTAAVSNTQLFRAVGCGRRCSRCCSRSRGQEELGGIYLFIYYGAAPLLPIPRPEGSHQVRSKQAPCWDEAQGAACPNPPASTSLVGGRCSSGFEPHHPPGDAVPSSEPSPSLLLSSPPRASPRALFVCLLAQCAPAGRKALAQ